MIVCLAAAIFSLSPPAVRYLKAPKRKKIITKAAAKENIGTINLSVKSTNEVKVPKQNISPMFTTVMTKMAPTPFRELAAVFPEHSRQQDRP